MASASLARPPGVGIFAHRGASGDCVENTVAAVRGALARDADGIEVDAMLASDGTVVVFHDDDLVRMAGRPERVAEMGWDELRHVRLRGGESIPRLEDVLEAWPADRLLNVELKAGGVPLTEAVLPLVHGRDGIVLSSFDPRMLQPARGGPHELALLLEARSPAWLWAHGAQTFGAAAVHLDHRLCAEATVRRYLTAGLTVGAWTVDDGARAAELARRGVQRLFTDWP